MSIGDEGVYPNEVHRAVMDTGAPLLWLNPNLNKIATAVVVAEPLRAPELGGGYPVRFTDGHDTSEFIVATGFGPAQLMIDPLDDARLTPTGIRTPRQDALEAARATLNAINTARTVVINEVRVRRDTELAAAAAKQAEAERARRIEADYQRAVTEAADARWYQQERDRAAADTAAREGRHARDQQRAQREASTRVAAAHDEVVEAFGTVPAFLSVPVGPHSPEQRTCWQWDVYADVIHWAVGGTFTLWDAYKAAAKTIGLGSTTGQAVRAWLAELVRMGILATKDKAHYTLVVPADVTVVIPARHEVRRTPVAPAAPRPLPPSLVPLGKVKTCKGCANPLLGGETSKYHTGCEPWQANAARWART